MFPKHEFLKILPSWCFPPTDTTVSCPNVGQIFTFTVTNCCWWQKPFSASERVTLTPAGEEQANVPLHRVPWGHRVEQGLRSPAALQEGKESICWMTDTLKRQLITVLLFFTKYILIVDAPRVALVLMYYSILLWGKCSMCMSAEAFTWGSSAVLTDSRICTRHKPGKNQAGHKKKLNLYLYQWVGLGSVCIHKVSRLSWRSFLEMWCTFIALKRMCGPFISVLIFCWVTYWKAVFRRFKLLVLNTWSTSASHELCLTLVAQLKEMKVDTLSNVLSLRRLPSLWSSLPFCLCIII